MNTNLSLRLLRVLNDISNPSTINLSIRHDIYNEDNRVMYKRLRNFLELDQYLLRNLYRFFFYGSHTDKPREFEDKFSRSRMGNTTAYYIFNQKAIFNAENNPIEMKVRLSWTNSYIEFTYKEYVLEIHFPIRWQGVDAFRKLLHDVEYVPRIPTNAEEEVMEFFYDYSDIEDYIDVV